MLRCSLAITSVVLLVSCSHAERFQPLLLSDVSYNLGRGESRIGGFATAYLNAAGQAVVEVDRVWYPTDIGSIGLEPALTSPVFIDGSSGSSTILALGNHGPRVVATSAIGLTSDAREGFRLQFGPAVGFNSPSTFLASGLNVDSEGNAIFVGLSDPLGTPLSGKPIWRGDGAALDRVVVEPLPGAESFARTELSAPLVSAGGTLAFGGLSIRQGPDLDIRSSVWRKNADGIALVAQEGNPAPGLEGLDYGSVGLAGLSGSGNAVLRGWAWRGIRGELTDGIWLATASGETELVASEGQQAPGAEPGVQFAFNMFPSIGGSTVAFSTTTIDRNGDYDNGVWADRGQGLQKVAASGDRVPIDGSDRIFTILGGSYEPAVNSRGDVAFAAWSNDAGLGAVGSTRGLWVEYAGGGLRSIVQSGDVAPNLEAGTEFYRLSVPALLSNGDALFTASLQGSNVTEENGFSLWRFDQEGSLTLILRTSDVLELMPGDERKVASFSLGGLGSGTDNGMPRSFNDMGQIALTVDFTDGTSGVVLYQPTAIPEPSAFITAAVGFILSIAHFRFKRL